MSKKFKNSRASSFLKSIPETECSSYVFAEKSKFNFSFFCGDQKAGQSIQDWATAEGGSSLQSLFDKLKNYNEKPLSYWKNERVGGGGLKVLAVYGDFPKKSNFTHPKAVPHDAQWARFRLGNMVRLIGFVIPTQLDGNEFTENKNVYRLCKNTFYIVFLDREHKFYTPGKENN